MTKSADGLGHAVGSGGVKRWLSRCVCALALVQAALLASACNNSWKFEQELAPPEATPAGIRGLAVALSGSIAAVTVNDPAGVEIYERSAAGAWTFVERIAPRAETLPLAPSTDFGRSLALDHDTLAIGVCNEVGATSPHRSDGYVDIYERREGRFVFREAVQPSPRPDTVRTSSFANALDLEGDVLVVGSNAYAERVGRVYVFKKSAKGSFEIFDELEPTPFEDSDRHFGFALDLSGNWLAVGQPGRGTRTSRPSNGDVRLYERTATGFDYRHTLLSPEPSPGGGVTDRFGSAVALRGQRLAVSQAAFRVYDPIASTFTDTTARVFLFERDGAGFTHTFTAEAEILDYFTLQQPLALTDDALVIGGYEWAPDTSRQAFGIVRVYHGSPPTLDSTLLDRAAAENRKFGIRVAASGDNLIVTTAADDDTSGSVYGFHLSPEVEP